jgi:hypothetical protein
MARFAVEGRVGAIPAKAWKEERGLRIEGEHFLAD